MLRESVSRSGGATFVATFVPLRARGGDARALALVDHVDYDEWVKDYRWFYNPGRGYAYRVIAGDGACGSVKAMMHREIADAPPGQEVDHRNRNKLDNRKANLRFVTRQQNSQNCSAHRDARSEHRGVDFHKGEGKWRARACINYVTHNLGLFDSEEEAAEAARAFRAEHMPYSHDDRGGQKR